MLLVPHLKEHRSQVILYHLLCKSSEKEKEMTVLLKQANNIKCSLLLNQTSLIIRLLCTEEGNNKYTQCLVSSSLSSTVKSRQKTSHHSYIYLTLDQITTWLGFETGINLLVWFGLLSKTTINYVLLVRDWLCSLSSF